MVKMLRGFYTAASGMISQQRKTEMLVNNMANVNTPGFKGEQSSMRAFPELLLQRFDKQSVPTQKPLNMPFSPQIGGLNTGVYMQEAIPQFAQGDIRETELNTDFALIDGTMPINPETGRSGTIFFSVEHPNGGQRYTRNGNFTLDAAGYLTTMNGLYVLNPEGNRILLANEDFNMNRAGEIMVNDAVVGRIGVAYADNPELLIKEGEGLYRTVNGENLPNAFNAAGVEFEVRQRFLERSNVDASQTMTAMLTAYRAFEANQKVLQAYDRSMDKAVNEIGRVN